MEDTNSNIKKIYVKPKNAYETKQYTFEQTVAH